MQPPPRKGNYAKFLKNLHTEQLAKLQLKNQNECELLEDIRNFIIKRSQIEKSYSEALLKISSAFLNKKIPNIPDIKTEGSEEKWNMWNVWRTVLEENEKLARARLAAVEVFSQHVADDAKILRNHKIISAKKTVDQLATVQKELQACVLDIDKTKKLYFDEEHSAHDVRDKAKDIEEKLKKKKGSFFQSITSLQKNSAKVTSKRDQLEEKSSGARNDYLLSLAAANAHSIRYFAVDLQNAIQFMEANVYERVQDYLMLIARTELLTCTATQTSFGRIKEQAHQLSRDYNIQCVYLYYPVLKQHITYDFEPCDNDTIEKITAEHTSAVETLRREAKRWATRIARENNNIRESTRKLQVFQALRDSGQKNDPNDPNGPDLETKIDELRQSIRRSETAKVKAEARIECLRAGGVNVEEWMQEVDNLSVQDLPRSASSMSVHTDASGAGEPPGSDSMYDSDYNDASSDLVGAEREKSQEEEVVEQPETSEVDGEWAMLEQERQRIEQLTAGWDDPTQVDWGAEESSEVTTDTAETVVANPDATVTYKCTALYNYTAQNPDELSIVENEQLEVIGEGDGDGWLRARNYRGEEGYVPHNYLDVERETATNGSALQSGGSTYQLTSQISFSSVDYTVDEVEEPSEQSIQQDTVREVHKPTHIDITGGKDQRTWAIALYDYEATCEDEITFNEGEVLEILRKIVHDNVDDGWWEGKIGDQVGLFPSLVVEECRENGEPLTPEGDDTPPGSAPPVFTPPDIPPFMLAPQSVIVTQPTPCGDQPSLGESSDKKSSQSFSMAMTRNQQDQYESQFDGDIQIEVTVDEEESESTAKVIVVEPGGGGRPPPPAAAPASAGLGVAQIVITAATPMMEEPEKPFPPLPEEVQEPEEPEKTAEEVPPEYSTACEVKEVKEKLPPVVPEDPDDDQPTDSAPFPISSSTGSEEDTYTGPSTADNSQSHSHPAAAPPVIPDELEPHQLARLQDLKESDA
ncbi:protein nervous wreck-like isoform X1 [Macrosteles quadrilineatus]|uniref:protein nervous wreck-like isoform X1 n=1 Tax=Macrosteles quadrilineatus TaxID=74068 RepID=UPI0023E1DE96|nr:protein nervous wreck-like isoform X1 [Macrosteles quadrilineatus]